VVAWGVDRGSGAHDHSTHQEHLGIMYGDHLEGPCLEESLLQVTQVDMGSWYHIHIDSVIA
jgi:hypothetical protein